jgi:uncharacterized membrane protein
MKNILTGFLLIIVFILSSYHLLAQTSAQLVNLGFGGAAKISNNGLYVCGNNYPAPGFLWSESAGRVSIGTGYTEAFGVSDNGIVAGTYLDSTLLDPYGKPTRRAGYFDHNIWNALPGYVSYPVQDSMSFTHAYGISGDGSMIVGMQWVPGYKAEAVYWDSQRDIHLLGRTGGSSSRANDVAVTDTGFIIAGWDGQSNGPGRRAFYWDPTPHFMGGYEPTYPDGQCEGLNSDGSKIVGGSVGAPFIWSQATGMDWITTDYLNYASYAKDISDNDIVVGYVSLGVGNFNAFIKRPEWNDILLLKDYMIDSLGINEVSDWLYSFANSISADGSTIVGTAYPASGGPIAYVLKFENPVPVELTSFAAAYENNKVLLDWTTNSELNNQGFDVESRTQNSQWNKIGFVNGNGTTTETNSYQFIDNSITSNKYYYRLKQVDFDGSFEYSNVVEVDINAVTEFTLNQNYPNPFNPSTKISFTLPQSTNVKLSVFNLLGEKVAELVNEVKSSGFYEVDFNGTDLTSGMYLYRLETGEFVSTRKMTLIK